MAKDKEQRALAAAFAVLELLSKHSLSRTQTKMARRAAGNCLWALGVDEYNGIKAVEPPRETIEHQQQGPLFIGKSPKTV